MMFGGGKIIGTFFYFVAMICVPATIIMYAFTLKINYIVLAVGLVSLFIGSYMFARPDY